MAPVRPDRLKAILDAALRLDEPERTAYLEAMWRGDPVLQTTIEQLLEGSGPVENFLPAFPAGILDTVLGTIDYAAAPDESAVPGFAGTDLFEIVRTLGTGGSGQVFEAFDRSLRMRVALKVLHNAQPDLVDRFKRGWRAVGALAHRNLCRIYQFIHHEQSDAWLLSMELVEGEPFTAYLQSHSDHLRDAFFQLAAALQVLHAANVCHGDVKPSNVLVTREGRVVLLDFGLSSRLDSKNVREQPPVAFTPMYAAPELFSGEVYSPASDWYSVGVMLREALRSMPPDGMEDLAELSRRLLDSRASARPHAAEILRILGPSVVHAGVARDDVPFVGREGQVRQIHDLFRQHVQAGRLALVHVSGVSGIGKTSFVEHTLGSLRQVTPNLTVIAGRCYQGESIPFKAVDEVAAGLASILEGLTPRDAHLLLPPHAHLLSRLFAIFGPVLRNLGVERRAAAEAAELHEFRGQAFAAFCRLISNVSLHAPLVVFIDDVQWGDLDSARLLKELIEGTRVAVAPAMLLILAYRSETGVAPNESLELLQQGDAITQIALGPLAPDQAVRLAATLLGEDFGSTEAARLATEAAGSPFFLRQLAEHKKAGGGVALGRVIQDRAASLAPLELRLLEVLAIARAPVSLAVLRDAAELGEQVRFVRSGLDSNCLIRSLGTPDEAVLPYHDRIAEVVLEGIPGERRKEIHQRIALALEGSGNADAERIALHFHSAGAFADACRLGRMAAERSAAGLAFERAAALYGKVLEWSRHSDCTLSPAEIAGLEQARGDSLVNCGRGVEAARAFQRAIPQAIPADAARLRIRSAAELLRAGEIREGLDSLRGILREYRLPFPESRANAIALFVRERLRLSLRLLIFRVFQIHHQPSGRLSPYHRARLEVCWAAATGMSMVYPLLTEIYCAVYLRLALRGGEARQLAVAWASQASRLAYIDDGEVRQARTMMSRAEQYANADGSPYVLAFVSGMWATIEGLNGNWRRCLEHASRSESLFRTRCVGVAWELATATSYLFTARTMLGEWTVNAAEMPSFLERARDRGDRYAEVTINLVSNSYAQYLVEDQPDLAEAAIEERLASWPRGEDFDIQQFYAFQSLINLDLYRGNPRRAWDRIRATWPAVERSGLLRITLMRTFLEDARARAAVALAPLAGPAERRRLLAVARRASRRLFRCKARYASGLACLLAAAIASIEGNVSGAKLHLQEAELSFERNDMIPWLATTRLALSEYLPDPDREQKIEAGMAWMNSQKIRRPQCLAKMLFPGTSFSHR